MKKLIALLLSAVMLLSAIPMVGAASFKDSADVTVINAEAVDIMSDLKVVAGFPEGDFKPNDTLTRAQAAKILCCVMLGTKDADALYSTGSTFSDVPASHWANKFVEYCASKGVVSGVGSGKFDPNGKLTGNAFGKMLLVALGADTSKLTGTGWDKNTQEQLKEKRIDLGVKVTGDELSRQDACHLALNALFHGEQTDVEGTLAYKAFGVVRASAGNNAALYKRPLVKYTCNDGDEYWEGSDKQITASPAFFSKSGQVKSATLLEALGVKDIEPEQLIQMRNGVKASAAKNPISSAKNISYTYGGHQFECYYAPDTDKYTFVILWQYGYKISAVTPAVFYSDGTVETPGVVSFENGFSCESNDFTEADVGTYASVYVMGSSSLHKPTKAVAAYKAKNVTGKLTAYNAKKSTLAIDGTTYKMASWYDKNSTIKKYTTDGGAIGDEVGIVLNDDNVIVALWKV